MYVYNMGKNTYALGPLDQEQKNRFNERNVATLLHVELNVATLLFPGVNQAADRPVRFDFKDDLKPPGWLVWLMTHQLAQSAKFTEGGRFQF